MPKLPFSAASALTIFLAVLIVGTVWRLGQLHLAASKSPSLRTLAQAMSFQY